MFNIFFQIFFVTWGEIFFWKFQHFWKKYKLVWKTVKVIIGYILLKADIPIIYLSCKWCPHPPPKEKKGFGFWPLVCVKKIKHTHTHTIYTDKLWKKSCLFTQHSFDGYEWTKWTLIHNALIFSLFDHFACKMGLRTSTKIISWYYSNIIVVQFAILNYIIVNDNTIMVYYNLPILFTGPIHVILWSSGRPPPMFKYVPTTIMLTI